MSKTKSSSDSIPAVIEWCIQALWVLIFAIFRLAFRVTVWAVGECFSGVQALIERHPKSSTTKTVVSRSEQVSTQNMAVPVKREVQVAENQVRDFEPTVVMNTPQKGEFIVSDRIKVVPVLAASDVQLGRITLYLYKTEGRIRRVFRVDHDHIRTLVGSARYYMSDVPWNVAAGEDELDRISEFSAREVVDIIERRQAQFSTEKSRSSRKAKAAAIGSPSNAGNPIRPSQQKPGEASGAALKQERSSDFQQGAVHAGKSEQSSSNHPGARETSETPKNDVLFQQSAAAPERPTIGRRYEGYVAEAGQVDRSGSEGTYKTYCMKLDVDGAHMPFYGVEIERELIERKVRLGDRIEVVFMGRSQISQAGEKPRFKNLYKVNVLKGK